MIKKRILVIDDESAVTRTLKTTLESTGSYDVLTENDPALALADAKNFHPDLIFMDVMMPQIDGGDVASQILDCFDLRNTPIVYLTALVSKQESHGLERTSPNYVLAKPVTLDELIDCIENHTRKPIAQQQ